MRNAVLAVLAIAVGAPCLGGVASAQPDYRWRGEEAQRDWDPADHYDGRHHHERRLSRTDYVYRGRDGRTYCRRSDGTTGLVVGGIGGALLGNAIGGHTLGTLLGAASGAAVGRAVERGQVRCR